jgi:hypothetical protein
MALPSIAAENRNYPQGPAYMANSLAMQVLQWSLPAWCENLITLPSIVAGDLKYTHLAADRINQIQTVVCAHPQACRAAELSRLGCTQIECIQGTPLATENLN